MDCNLLIDPLPLTIPVGGGDLPIETNFRTGILFEMMINDGDLTDHEKMIHAANLWFPESFPDDDEEQIEAFDGMLWFYSCGKETLKQPQEAKQETTSKVKTLNRRIYDYDVDAPLIYAAFLSQYRIDLQDIEYLHWWKFSAMFRGLSDGHEITKIMGYRSMDLSSIKNKAERQHYTKLQAKFALPDNRSIEEKQQAAGALFGGALFR